MTQIPAGWYPDPDPDAPEPRGIRYWDGQNWTEHVQPAPGQAPAAPPASYPTGQPTGQPSGETPGAGAGFPGQAAGYPGQTAGYAEAAGYPGQTPGYAPMAAYGGAVGAAGPTTPDGQLVSGWGRRAGGWVIDFLVWLTATGLIGFAWIRDIFAAYTDFFSSALESGQTGQPPGLAEQMELMESISGPMSMITLVGIAVSFVYNVGLWKWRAATLGQMAVGIKVRLRDHPGSLSWGTVLVRWLGKQGYRLLNLIPFVGIVGLIYQLLNYLWPLWDDKNQALHDKLAKTNVVRT
jgi:uncharacterized RDD family membrane protein YckC